MFTHSLQYTRHFFPLPLGFAISRPTQNVPPGRFAVIEGRTKAVCAFQRKASSAEAEGAGRRGKGGGDGRGPRLDRVKAPLRRIQDSLRALSPLSLGAAISSSVANWPRCPRLQVDTVCLVRWTKT